MDTVIFDASDRPAWDEFVAASRYGHVLQSWAWGEVKARTGWEATRLGLVQEGRMAGAAQVLIRSLPYGLGRLAYVPKGPVVDYGKLDDLRHIVAALREFAAANEVISLKIEPEIREPASEVAWELEAFGLKQSLPVQMRSTIWVDLTAGEDEMLARQKQKTRYNIRLAAKRGVCVETGSLEDLQAWYELYEITAKRDHFTIHNLDYYRTVLEELIPRGEAVLLLARHDRDLLAGNIVFAFGSSSIYMYGASGNEKRNLMAPYLLQWEGMRWAKQRGARVYDMWGIPDRLHEGEDLWGVYRHKSGYGGEIVRYAGAYDLVVSPARHFALERVGRPLFRRVARLSA